jgi:hypothetical protein
VTIWREWFPWFFRVEIPMKQDGKNAPKVRTGESMSQTSGVVPQLTKGGKKKGAGKKDC